MRLRTSRTGGSPPRCSSRLPSASRCCSRARPGVGKTELAKSLATASGARLIRLQCYEGLDVAHAVYEWNYARQLLHIRAAQEGTVDEQELFGPEFLIRRPLLEAIASEEPVVLLIDEIDRADDEFEAFLLEVLSDFQITIPEIGTIAAKHRPAVILTSNRTRELHDALKRRCLFHWITHPTLEREIEIVRLRVPGVPERLAAEAAAFVAGLRGARPRQGARASRRRSTGRNALDALGCEELDADVVEQTLGSVLKYHEDLEHAPRRDRRRAAARGARRHHGVGAVSDAPRPPRRHVRPRPARGRARGRAGPRRRRARGLDHVDLTRQEDVYWALRTTLVSRREDLDALRPRVRGLVPRAALQLPPRPNEDPRPTREGAPDAARLAGRETRRRPTASPEEVGHSAHEVLRRKDFAAMTPGGDRGRARPHRGDRHGAPDRAARTGCSRTAAATGSTCGR